MVKSIVAEPARLASVATAKPVTEISDTELRRAVEVVNQAVALEQRSLSFSIDDASGRSVIKVVDFETNELIKQIPTEELLKVAQDIKRLQDEMGQSIGLLIDNKV
jgi:flagellar protein FlaG